MSDRFPWFPFYVADWRTSNTVRAMTYEQRGVFLELLAIAWDDGIQKPSLPDDDAVLAQILNLGKRWTKIMAPLRTCFTSENGRLYNDRLTKVWEIQRAKYEIASIAGKESAKQRALRSRSNGKSTDVQRTFNGRSRSVPTARATEGQRKPNHTDADTDRTKSSSAPTAVGALTDGALAAAVRERSS